ncbi:MAG: hypothetical protein GY906_12580 [bacterium]|nr:hypothetical protein [bacterium]
MPTREESAQFNRSTAYLLVLAGVFIITSAAAFYLPEYWPIWAAIAVVVVITLVVWHNRSFDYRCKYCNTTFAISVWRNLRSAHVPTETGGEKYLCCPACSINDWAQIVRKD